jgi:hypothetical protein
MGWLISFLLMCGYINGARRDEILIAAGLFAIAGSISFVKVVIEQRKK